MNELKQRIIRDIKRILQDRISSVHIIGSFSTDRWDSNVSDIDLVCIDESLKYFPYHVALQDINNRVSDIGIRFDIKLISQELFDYRLITDSEFKIKIREGLKLW
jgi:predicted nucleotidyltransferase